MMLDTEIIVNTVDIRNFSSADWRYGRRALQARGTGAVYMYLHVNHGELRSTILLALGLATK